jgi:hypothetical protein
MNNYSWLDIIKLKVALQLYRIITLSVLLRIILAFLVGCNHSFGGFFRWMLHTRRIHQTINATLNKGGKKWSFLTGRASLQQHSNRP